MRRQEVEPGSTNQVRPDRVRHPLAVAMEVESASYFGAERDLSALADDVRGGRAQAVGLSPEYALVATRDGVRYYVRIDAQRGLAADLLKPDLRRADRKSSRSRPFSLRVRR